MSTPQSGIVAGTLAQHAITVASPGAGLIQHRNKHGQRALMSQSHAIAEPGRYAISHVDSQMQNLATVFQGSATYIDMRIPKNSLGLVKTITLHERILLGAGTAANLLPVNWHMTSIEWFSNATVSDVIQRKFDVWSWFDHGFLPHDVLEDLCTLEGWNNKTWWLTADPMAAGESRDFYLPISMNTFVESFESHGVDLSALDNDFVLRINYRSEIRTNASFAGVGIPSLNSLELLIEADVHDQFDPREANALSRTFDRVTNFIDDQDLSMDAQALAPSTRKTIQLTQLSGKLIAGLLVGVRAGTSTVAGQLMDFIDLGARATLDVLDGSSNSLFGSGTPVQVEYLKGVVMPSIMGGDVAKYTNLVVLPFSHNFARAMTGDIKGSMRVLNNAYQLSITPDAALIAADYEVHTVTQGAAITAGYYAFSYKGQISSYIVWNSNVAAMKAAFEAIPAAYEDGVTVTFSAAASAGAAFTCTFIDPGTFPLIGFVPGAGVTGTTTVVVTRSTRGKRGFVAGNYSVCIHALVYRRLHLLPNGKMEHEDM